MGLTIDTDATQPQVEVLAGNGAGGFSGTAFTQAIYGNPDGPVPTDWVAVADLNNDGYPDLVTSIGAGIVYTSNLGSSFPLKGSTAPGDGAAAVWWRTTIPSRLPGIRIWRRTLRLRWTAQLRLSQQGSPQHSY